MPEYAKVVISFVVVAVFVMMASSWSSNLGAEARYLPTRSDPLAVVGPPRGEDPRFDRVYAIVRELLKTGMMIDNIYEEDNVRSVNRKQFDDARPF